MSTGIRRRLRAGPAAAVAVAVAVVAAGFGLAAPAAAAPHADDTVITVHTGGDRSSALANTVDGVEGVTFRAKGQTVPEDTATCTTGSGGTCEIDIDSATRQSYTVTVVSTPSNWVAWESRGGQLAFSRLEHSPPTECGLRVAMVFDLSYSLIYPANYLQRYLAAGQDFVDALQGTPSHIALYTFGTNAPANNTNNANLPLTSVATAAGADEVKGHIQGFNTNSTQYTDWDAGLAQVASSSARYDDVIMLTDGDPTRYGRPTATTPYPTVATSRFLDVENGIFSANAVKARPGYSVAHPTVIAVGINVPSIASHEDLRSISAAGDYYTTDFSDLAETLRSLARSQCEGTISVVKHVVPHGGSVEEARPGGAGWGFSSSVPPQAKKTGDDSVVNFATTGTTPTSIIAHEKNGYHLLSDETRCRYTDSDAPVPYERLGNGVRVTPDPERAITCDVYNQEPPQLELEKSADPDHFTAAGQWITYTYRVTNNGTVPLSQDVVIDDKLGFICEIRELAPGESRTCEFGHLTTQADVEAGSIHNTAFAKGEDEVTGAEVYSPEGSPESEATVSGPPVVPVTG